MISTLRGTIKCDEVVVAVGPWVNQVWNMLDLPKSVSIKGKDGNTYMVLKMEGDGQNVANPSVLKIQSHEVSVEGDLYERDGVKYLIVTQVHDDKGVINLTHEEYGVQP